MLLLWSKQAPKKTGGGLRYLNLYYLEPCLTFVVNGKTIFIATHPKRDCCFRGLMLRKVMSTQQLFEVNVKVRGRPTCVKILKLGDSSLDGDVCISLS